MAVISTGSYPKALWPGINAWWGTYNEHPKEFPDLFEIRQSDMNYEEIVEDTGFGLAPVKPQGSSIEYDSAQQGTVSRFTNVAYALGYIVTFEEMRDNLYAKVAQTRTQKLAFSMRQTKETVHANIYNYGFGTTKATGGDGKALFASDHPTLNGTQSNILSVAADLSETSLEDMCINIYTALNSRGLKAAIMPQALVVPPQLWFEAQRILKSVLQNNTGENAINALRATNAIPDGIKMNHYLSDSDAWFVRTNAMNGLISFERDALIFEQDNDGDTKNIKYNAYERYVPYWADWRGCFGSPGA